MREARIVCLSSLTACTLCTTRRSMGEFRSISPGIYMSCTQYYAWHGNASISIHLFHHVIPSCYSIMLFLMFFRHIQSSLHCAQVGKVDHLATRDSSTKYKVPILWRTYPAMCQPIYSSTGQQLCCRILHVWNKRPMDGQFTCRQLIHIANGPLLLGLWWLIYRGDSLLFGGYGRTEASATVTREIRAFCG